MSKKKQKLLEKQKNVNQNEQIFEKKKLNHVHDKCIDHCSQGALHVVQYSETKEHLQDYFEKLNAKW